MDFNFDDEQQMLLDSTRRLIGERYNFDYRNRVRASAEGWSRDTWQELAELGLLGLNVPEADGGIGAGPVGSLLVGNAIGEGLLLEPFLASAVIATEAIVRLASAAQRAEWLPRMIGGELIAVLVHDPALVNGDPAAAAMRATRDADGWLLDGHSALVYHAPSADLLLIAARLADGTLAVFAVPSTTAGIALNASTTVDEQRAARVTCSRVRVAAGARVGDSDATAALSAVLDVGLAALCAEAFGAMDRLLKATIEYTRSRVQFGVPIGSFQALQHRMAEMLMHLEQARSMSYLAASSCADPDPVARGTALSAAKALMGQAARYIGQQAVQLHGGMGMTDELDVSHYFKRLLAFELRGGTTDEHLAAYRKQLQAG